MKEKDKREAGGRGQNEQQRAALSSILAQVGSGPGIVSNPRGALL